MRDTVGLAKMTEPGIFAAMTPKFPLCLAIAGPLLLCSLPPSLAQAQTPPPATAPTPGGDAHAVKPAPYDARLMRMAEIVGSVTYLRTLCADAKAGEWRSDMQALIDREAGGEPDRKARLTAAFNRGYRSFASVYTSCTPSAVLADKRYRDEGATLAAEIVSRFGN
ncbi:TIGR02301 family protein [Rhizobium sp. NFR03]|nr:TIGR02301 family protein [Rhizobium sp. NFR03]